MDLHPSNQKVLIIGATSGIGRELARLYAAAGNTVGATGRRQDLLDSLHAEYPDRIFTANSDATAPDAATRLATLAQRLGGLDILIFNAGWGDLSDTLDWNIDKPTVDINVNAFLTAIHFGWNYFIRQGHGHLATVSSIAANRGNRHSPAYSAAKSFQSIYFEGLYIKSRKMNIPLYVTDIQPGYVDTKMSKGPVAFWVAPPEKAARQIIRAIEKRRRRVYVTRRWRIIARLFRWIPGWIYYRIG
ncbi:MAG TPA: SDR family NAD(P)-dependent oxidoreductase [Puia sp.]|jgi:short-subunit dehydrogenase|nr:SDR family NAD(P)-dependent oxidoreductase [Puia sp.]